METTKLEINIGRAYEYLTKTSEVFRNLSMDQQGEISIKLGKELSAGNVKLNGGMAETLLISRALLA